MCREIVGSNKDVKNLTMLIFLRLSKTYTLTILLKTW